MRILYTVDPEIPVPPVHYGGIERIVDALAQEMKRRHHDVGLVAHPDSTCAVDRFAWPRICSGGLVNGVMNTRRLNQIVKEWNPDIIHSFSRLGYLIPQLIARKPSIMSYQRHTGGYQIRMATALNPMNLTFTGCSEFICRQGRQSGGRWHAIHNFVELEKYPFRRQVPTEAPLVFLGRIERIKGVDLAIDIAKRAQRQLIIAGNYQTDGDEGDYWRSEILPEVDGTIIKYVGPVDDVAKRQLLGCASALICPIQWDEPFGIVFTEALACGTPVITCARGAVPEIIRNGKEGFMISDVDNGVRAVRQLPEISRLDCRLRVEGRFTLAHISDLYLALYNSLLHPKI